MLEKRSIHRSARVRAGQSFALAVALVCLTIAGAQAQQGEGRCSPCAPAIPARAQRTPQATTAVAPQVITVIHRLSGWKLLVWINRNSAQQVTGFDYQLLTEQRAHTNIVAGYVLRDGRTVVARLPQAEAEIEPVVAPPELRAGGAGASEQQQPSEFLIVRNDGSQVRATFVGLDARTGLSVLRADEPLFVSAQAPRARVAHGAGGTPGVGASGGIGSSIGRGVGYAPGQRIRLYAPAPQMGRVSQTLSATRAGAPVRLNPRSSQGTQTAPAQVVVPSSQTAQVSPQPVEPAVSAPQSPAAPVATQPPGQPAPVIERTEVFTTTVTPRASGAPVGDEGFIYMRLAETEGRLMQLSRAPLLETARLSVRAEGLNPTYAGAVALGESGEFVGIVERLSGNEARLLPSRAAHSAAERVLAQRTSIPHAWLGASGSALASSPALLPLLVRHGWSAEQARTVARLQHGVLLTAIAPGAPAALAGLRPGDVVTRIGETQIRTIEDFTRLIRTAGAGAEVRFTLLRTDQREPGQVLVRLGESLNPRMATEAAIVRGMPPAGLTRIARPAGVNALSLPVGLGLESIVLASEHAARFERPSVMIVLTVRPESAAHRLGLRPGDVILSVNGQSLHENQWREKFSTLPANGVVLELRRNNQQIRLGGTATGGSNQ